MHPRTSTKRNRPAITAAIAFAALAAISRDAGAALTYYVEPNGWPSAAHRDAAVAAMQSAVNRYNAYGDFGNHSVYVYYNAGIPTAQASYLGSIGFGGTYPNERVTMHELAHYLGSGTYGDPWNGPRGEAMVDQFDGLQAELNGDSQHFWPYGLNYDSEGAEINKQRNVALVYAQRADMGIGSTAIPGSATSVTLRATDPSGESGFNYANTWSDNRFAHPNAAYSTGNFILRTPASGNSFTFVGDSLRVNNTNGVNGGLLYKGTGTSGVTTFKNLILDGGYVRHASGAGDLFRLGGKVTLASSSTIDAAQGPVTVSASIGGTGSLTKTGAYPLVLSGGSTYGGTTTINAGTLRLAPTSAVADYTFDNVIGGTAINAGTGGPGMNGTLANGATVVSDGRFGNAVRLPGGASVNINSGIVDLGTNTSWTVSAWLKTTTPGASILTKGNGTGWDYGNTIFYLGDGAGPGIGGIPSAVRYAGGFLQASTSAPSVNDNAWHQVTYVNAGGAYAIFVDGVPQPLSSGNSSFSVPDIGTMVRLGVSTNTVAADGTRNFIGLLDSVQFYDQALSPAQVAALYQGRSVGPLPSTTDVMIASGATLDVNGITQQIGSLRGPAGSAVTLGAGQLIVNSATSTDFGGRISGTGSLMKGGTGTLTLAGTNTYTGPTLLEGGALRVTGSIDSSSQIVVNGGDLILADTPDPDATLAATLAKIRQGYAGGSWTGAGGITSTAARDDATRLTTLAAALTNDTDILVRRTYHGDANLDGRVNSDDYFRIDSGFLSQPATPTYAQGDFNYDGRINSDDYFLIDRAFLGQGAPFGTSDAAIAAASVPEPTSAGLLCALSLIARRRRRDPRPNDAGRSIKS